MFASSVHFEIELVPLTFVQALQARPLDGADMDKCIRLAIVAYQEAEALHGIEKLDRAGRLFACQLTLGCTARRGPTGSAASALNRNHVTHNLQILRRSLAAAVNQIVFERLPFGQAFQSGTFDGTDMDEHVLAATILLDEAKTLLRVEEFYDAFAGPDDLGRHTVATAASGSTASASAAAETAAAAIATTKAITASAKTVATAKPITATKTVTAAVAVAAKTASAERIEAVLSETIALIAAPSTAPFIITHSLIRTFVSPPNSQHLCTRGGVCARLP